MKVKSMERIKRKWVDSVVGRQEEYREGVRNPRADWKEETVKAESSYEAGIQAAISKKRFGKGVSKAGTEKWQKQALAKGPDRWAQGVSLAADDYDTGFAPFRSVLERITLPPRGPKGDPKNIQRVAAIAKAMHDAKVGGGG